MKDDELVFHELSDPQVSALLAGYSMGYVAGCAQAGAKPDSIDLTGRLDAIMQETPTFINARPMARITAARQLANGAVRESQDG